MGNYSIALVCAALIGLSLVTNNAKRSTYGSDVVLSNHVMKEIAREAALTGFNMTVRRLVADTASWSVNEASYEYDDSNYHLSHFTTDVRPVYSPTEAIGACNIDTVDVVSKGLADGGGWHEVKATVVRTCSSVAGRPPQYDYAVISDLDMTLNGSQKIWSGDGIENADIHTNQKLTVNGGNNVQGFGSYTESSVINPQEWVYEQFLPVDDWNGATYNTYQKAHIDIDTFVPEDYLDQATYIDNGDVTLNGVVNLDFTDFNGVTGYGTQENPFIWYVDGRLIFNGLTRTTGYVVIITTDDIIFNGNAKVVSSLEGATAPPESWPWSPNTEASRAWIAQYLSEGTMLGVYTSADVTYNGQGVFVGQITANGKVTLNGSNTIYGGIVTKEKLTFNGTLMEWAKGPNDAILLGSGTNSSLPDGVRLLAFAEF